MVLLVSLIVFLLYSHLNHYEFYLLSFAVDITNQQPSYDINIIFIIFNITITSKMFQFLADKLTLGKASLELNEAVEPALTTRCRQLITIKILVCKKSFFFHENVSGFYLYFSFYRFT